MTVMPRSASVRELSGLISRSRVGSAESGRTTQRTPAGTDPTATPEASLTNSSPLSGPPIEAVVPPTAMPMRSSGSAPGAGPAGRGPRQAAARTARLTAPCFVQRRIELLDGDVDIRLRMRVRNESRLECRRCEEDAALKRGSVPTREQRGVGAFCVAIIAHPCDAEVDAPHRPGRSEAGLDSLAMHRVDQSLEQPRRAQFQRFVETATRRLA